MMSNGTLHATHISAETKSIPVFGHFFLLPISIALYPKQEHEQHICAQYNSSITNRVGTLQEFLLIPEAAAAFSVFLSKEFCAESLVTIYCCLHHHRWPTVAHTSCSYVGILCASVGI
jgi:hypothetical protein